MSNRVRKPRHSVRHADKILGYDGELVNALKPLRQEFNQAVDEWFEQSQKLKQKE